MEAEEQSLTTHLKREWINERESPEILPYQDELVDIVRNRMKEQREDLSGEYSSAPEQFLANLYELELQRVGFLLRSYLRTRLKKIEKYWLYITNNPSEMDKLSPAEQHYAKKYRSLIERNFNTSFLSFLPENMRPVPDAPPPNLDVFVFCKVQDTIGRVLLDEEREVEGEMVKGDIWMVQYSMIQDYLLEDKVHLI